MSFVNGVTNTIVTEKHYQPLLRGLIFGFQLIDIFSDALSNFKDESGDEKKFSFVEIEDIITNTEIVDIILSNAKEGLIDELNEAIDKDIEYKTGIHINPFGEAVAKLLGTLEQRIKDVDLKALMGFAEIFKNIPAEEVTYEKMFDAYAKSEAFKKIQENADERSAQRTARVIELVGEAKKSKTTKESKSTKTATKKTTKVVKETDKEASQ